MILDVIVIEEIQDLSAVGYKVKTEYTHYLFRCHSVVVKTQYIKKTNDPLGYKKINVSYEVSAYPFERKDRFNYLTSVGEVEKYIFDMNQYKKVIDFYLENWSLLYLERGLDSEARKIIQTFELSLPTIYNNILALVEFDTDIHNFLASLFGFVPLNVTSNKKTFGRINSTVAPQHLDIIDNFCFEANEVLIEHAIKTNSKTIIVCDKKQLKHLDPTEVLIVEFKK